MQGLAETELDFIRKKKHRDLDGVLKRIIRMRWVSCVVLMWKKKIRIKCLFKVNARTKCTIEATKIEALQRSTVNDKKLM